MLHVDVNKLNGKIAERNTTKEAVADAIGVNRSTFYRRLKSSTLTIRDIHAIKELLRIRCSARYMDDGYLIHESKAYLRRCLSLIQEVCDRLEITLNPKKTQIVKLSHGFTWLQIRVFLTPTGRIVKKMPRKGIVKMRQKLKKLRRKLDAGEITCEDVWASWQSWRSHALRFDAWRTLQSMEQLYNKLFVFTEGL